MSGLPIGKILQKAQVTNAADLLAVEFGYAQLTQVRGTEVEFLVDTGAAMLCLPIDTIEGLGLKPQQERQVMTANGIAQRRVFSPVRLKVWDREANLDVMELPNGTPPLMGYLALETLDLYPNPKEQKLEGNPKYDGKMMIDCL
jgi:predicted aspartyl protease